jgi:predicted DNA binding CopG/RHH family protein
MDSMKTIKGTEDAWDKGPLGTEEQFTQKAHAEAESSLDASLGMQMISIRLPIELIADLKKIAIAHHIGYQPLMRDALTRFATAEFKRIATEAINQKANEVTQPQKTKHSPRHKEAA